MDFTSQAFRRSRKESIQPPYSPVVCSSVKFKSDLEGKFFSNLTNPVPNLLLDSMFKGRKPGQASYDWEKTGRMRRQI